MDLSKAHILTMCSNPVRYASRYRLYEQFRQRIERAGLTLWTAEIAFGERPFTLTQSDDIHDLQLRTKTELWHKENALALLVQRLSIVCPDWQYVFILDADIEFPNWTGDRAWFVEAVHQLQHYRVIQLFQNAIDLGPNGETLHTHNGFAYSYRMGLPFKQGYANWHPGFAWGMTRECYEATGLVTWGILGSGDRHMACGWIGKIEQSLNKQCQTPYLRKLLAWQEQAERYVRRDIGFLPGTILHHWHGRKKNRFYADRWKILTQLKFDPDRDIKADSQGLYVWADHGDLRSIQLRDRVRDYFRARQEDSIDLE